MDQFLIDRMLHRRNTCSLKRASNQTAIGENTGNEAIGWVAGVFYNLVPTAPGRAADSCTLSSNIVAALCAAGALHMA